ncbi:hypothetical protein UM91_09995 [Pseudomonas oryzihabitans]|nr:hypothetical protein UM91_09995 [Pseudomonas oryzihabitans]
MAAIVQARTAASADRHGRDHGRVARKRARARAKASAARDGANAEVDGSGARRRGKSPAVTLPIAAMGRSYRQLMLL